MTENKFFNLYAGTGQKLTERGGELPPSERTVENEGPARYVASRELRDAVNVALVLGQPLLVTGEPGTGKTQLAGSISYELELAPPLVFRTKTTSTAKDLFYRYDALRHFHDANVIKKETTLRVEDYITYDALGLAIISALSSSQSPRRSVVLVDEVDKAPRDFPNDILN